MGLTDRLDYHDREIWNDGYARGLRDAGAIKVEFDLETVKDRLKKICTTDNESKEQFIRRVKSILSEA